ncbi:hypothetical protein [Streptomyces sp. t99]|uniref:hypothetical protein n=1 Tax=Streptomyces sp. t99 TaxID=1828172 RepID=UPI00117CB4DD|nr:hypothetical protein [Streptomyces sp. t99]
MREPRNIPADTGRLQGHAERAFIEVQRADTKATALCGIAGGLLAAGVAVLSGAHSMPSIAVFSLILMCLLLMAAIGAALLALRPAIPGAGLRTELMSEALMRHRADMSTATRGELELHVEGRRLEVLARLAGKKLRAARMAVDFALAGIMMAGMCLLSNILVD